MKSVTGEIREIKAVHHNCYNNCKSGSIKSIYTNTGANIRTDIMVTLIDGTRRRVFAQVGTSQYLLFVRIEGEKIQLMENAYTPANVISIDRMTTNYIKGLK